VRKSLGEAAVRAARAVNYVGAGEIRITCIALRLLPCHEDLRFRRSGGNILDSVCIPATCFLLLVVLGPVVGDCSTAFYCRAVIDSDLGPALLNL